MKNLIILISFLTLSAGCAKTSDVESLTKRVTVLEEKVAGLETDINAVKVAVADAASKAAAAEVAANRAAELIEETNNKLNKIIKQNCGQSC